MKRPTYFFINYTRKEFCHFQNNVPVFEAIGSFINDETGWTNDHNIVVVSDKKYYFQRIKDNFLKGGFKDISVMLKNIKKKWTWLDILLCCSIRSVEDSLWESLLVVSIPLAEPMVEPMVKPMAEPLVKPMVEPLAEDLEPLVKLI